MLVYSEKNILPYSFFLVNICSSNVAEYQVLILGLQIAIGMGIKDLDVYGDSQQVINKLLEEFKVKKDNLIPHYKNTLHLLDKLETIKLEHVPRSANKMVDALANLAATLALRVEESITISVYAQCVITPLVDGGVEEVKTVSIYEIDEEDWHQPLIDYLEHRRLSSESRRTTELQRRSSRFLYYKGTFYRRSFLGLCLQWLDNKEGKKVMEEAHASVWGCISQG